jgi:uncharacterized protein YjiS (DUF1127 family)
MERGMDESDEFHFLRFEHLPLTPEQLDHLKRSAIRSAKQARTQAVRSLFVGIATALQAAAIGGREMVRNRWHAYTGWRERRESIRELRALDDRSLKDIGLHRSEIESVICDSKHPTEERVAVARFPKTGARSGTGRHLMPSQVTKQMTKQPTRKNAA